MYTRIGYIGTLQSVMMATESPSLKIVPELSDYWLIKGSPLKLDCIYTRPKNADPETFDFSYNGRVVEHRLDGFEVITNVQVFDGDNAISTITLTKYLHKATDAGLFRCTTPSGIGAMISVHLFTVSLRNDNLTDADLTDESASLNLQCNPEGVDPLAYVKLQVTWMRNGKNITTDSKYSIHANDNTLVINDPVRADAGKYSCEIVFNAGYADEYRVMPNPLFVRVKTITPSVLWMTRCTVALGLRPRATVHRVIHSTSWVIVLTVAQKDKTTVSAAVHMFTRFIIFDLCLVFIVNFVL